MTKGEEIALGILASTGDLSMGRLDLGQKIARAIDQSDKEERVLLTAAYHDLCAVLGWAVDDKPATAEMVARAAKAVAKQYPAFRSYPAQA